MRLLLVSLVIAGCGFEHGQLAEERPDASYGGGTWGGSGQGSGGGSDTTPLPRTCKYPDAAHLQLCIELDDGAISPVVHDASSAQLDGAASGLTAVMRSPSDPAANITNGSIQLPEVESLDISDAITIEMWIQPYYYQAASLLRNDGQYVMQMTGGGQLGCSLAGTQVYDNSYLIPGVWYHVACTFDGETVTAYVNGSATSCGSGSSKISTSGTTGTTIAPNFRGGIDGIRVYSRKLDSNELCTHAGRTSCQTQCD